MMAKLSNREIRMLVGALTAFNPAEISFKMKRRLARNLRKATIVLGDFERERERLMYSHIEDKIKVPPSLQNNQGLVLTPREYEKYFPELCKLEAEEEEIEIHQIAIVSGPEDSEKDGPTIPEDGINVNCRAVKAALQPAILAIFDGIIFPEDATEN